MPELPEVETMRRGVLPVVGGDIVDVHFVKSRFKKILVQPRRDAFRRRVTDQRIAAVGRLGKRVLLHLANESTVVIEPRMTGLLLLAEPPDEDHLRVGFHLSGAPVPWLWFWDRRGLGTVRLLNRLQMTELAEERLGPDALEIDVPEMRQRLGKSKRAIKVALLDQQAIAGIGNLYASELLHRARVHPQKRCDLLSKRQWTLIHAAMVSVLHEAIRYEGSTLSDGTYRNALNRQGGYQNCHRVYNRRDEVCPSCGVTRIVRIVQAQRSTFFCPSCQKKSSRS
jgi:formamidopyrimidine-DNA glycosylase